MSIASRLSGHWTDEQLIDYLYQADPVKGHLGECLACRTRLASMQQRRQAVEEQAWDGVESVFLAAQRRQIYEKVARVCVAGSGRHVRALASAAAALLAIAAGLVVLEHRTTGHSGGSQGLRQPSSVLTDSQLASDVGEMAEKSEPQSTAPLQALFAE